METNNTLIVTDSLKEKVNDIRKEKNNDNIYLRVTVEGGGCSGFRYDYSWSEDTSSKDDLVFEDCLVTDEFSLEILGGSKIEYKKTLMGENFQISNPNAKSGCGCGNSFST